jgi:hypothetical protein
MPDYPPDLLRTVSGLARDVARLKRQVLLLQTGPGLFTPTHSTTSTNLSTTLSAFTTVYTAPSATYLANHRYLLSFYGALIRASASGGNNGYNVQIMSGATVLGVQTTGNSGASSYAAADCTVDWQPTVDTTVALAVQAAQVFGTVTAASIFAASGGGGYYTLVAQDLGVL